jgi:hypothetical protein
LQLGAPTGGDKGAGTLNLAAALYVNNSSVISSTGAVTPVTTTATGNYVCANASGTALTIEAAACPASDWNVKRDWRELDGKRVLAALAKKRVGSFIYKPGKGAPGRHLGTVAQDWEEDFPELVTHDPDGTRHFDYNGAFAVLLVTLKEQQREIEALKLRR